MLNLIPDVKPVEEVDLNTLTFFDPDADEVFEQKYLIVIKTELPNGELQGVNFLIRKVLISQVLLELSAEDAVELQNAQRDRRERKADEPTTVEEVRGNRLLYEFNLASVRLGLIEPVMSDERLRQLPHYVITELSLAITTPDVVPEEEEQDQEQEE